MNWISVEDRLPSEFQRVIAFCSIDVYSHEQEVVHEVQYMGNRKFISLTKKDIAVKRWMPLPEPPK